jgi:2-haloacid dehalogenase
MDPLLGIKVLAFDAYGTLFDVHSVVQLAEKMFPGKGLLLSQLWRTKQIEYMFIRSLMGKYIPHDQNTELALKYAMHFLGLSGGDQERKELMKAYEVLSPFGDVKHALEKLGHVKKSILSVGTPALIKSLVNHAGLAHFFDELFSVDEVKIYKPHPLTYQLVMDKFGVEKDQIAFITSNYFDVVGAKAFGFKVIWVNRNHIVPDELTLKPDIELNSIDQLPIIIQ